MNRRIEIRAFDPRLSRDNFRRQDTLSRDMRAVLELGAERNIVERHGNDFARDGEDFARAPQAFVEGAVDIRKRRDKEIAETLTGETAFVETIVKEFLHFVFFIGERKETVARIARRQNAEFATQNPRAAAVVRDGDDRRDFVGKRFEPAKERGASRAAPDRDDG